MTEKRVEKYKIAFGLEINGVRNKKGLQAAMCCSTSVTEKRVEKCAALYDSGMNRRASLMRLRNEGS